MFVFILQVMTKKLIISLIFAGSSAPQVSKETICSQH